MVKRGSFRLLVVSVFILFISAFSFVGLAYAATPPPTLTSPASNAIVGQQIPISFNLPAAPAANSVKLIFVGSSTYTVTLNTSTSGSTSFTLNNVNLILSSQVVSVSPSVTKIPDGTYSVVLSYQDVALDPAATASATNVVIDSVNPGVTSTSPANNQTGVLTTSPLVMVFSKTVSAGSGSISIVDNTNNNSFESIPVNSGQVGGNGTTTITIATSTAFNPGTSYTVSVPAGAFIDHAGNASPAVSWQFTTAATVTSTGVPSPSSTTARLTDTGLQISSISVLSFLLLVAAIIVYRSRASI